MLRHASLAPAASRLAALARPTLVVSPSPVHFVDSGSCVGNEAAPAAGVPAMMPSASGTIA
eukprot:2356290-Alexandrium_andersonii.AAC.1